MAASRGARASCSVRPSIASSSSPSSDLDATTRAIVTRDGIDLTPKGVSFGEGASFGARGRLYVRASNAALAPGRVEVGRGVRVGADLLVEVFSGQRLSIGDHTTMGDRCVLMGDVAIGRHCLFSSNIYMSSGDHQARQNPSWLIHDQDAAGGPTPTSQAIDIGEDCWIGWGVFVRRGVSVGRGAILGANAVVTRDVPPYSVQAGAPSREVSRRLEFAPPPAIDARDETHWPYFYEGFALRQSDVRVGPQGMLRAHSRARAVLRGGSASSVVVRGENLRPHAIENRRALPRRRRADSARRARRVRAPARARLRAQRLRRSSVLLARLHGRRFRDEPQQ